MMLKDMTEGVHFHRDGRRARRVIIHVREADRWLPQRAHVRKNQGSIEELAIDEVTRRRASMALKRTKGTK